MATKRPWKIAALFAPSKTFGSLETALAYAFAEGFKYGVGWETLIQNYDEKVAYRVYHLEGFRVMARKMTWGPDDKWLA